jgi:hypothetical protein
MHQGRQRFGQTKGSSCSGVRDNRRAPRFGLPEPIWPTCVPTTAAGSTGELDPEPPGNDDEDDRTERAAQVPSPTSPPEQRARGGEHDPLTG